MRKQIKKYGERNIISFTKEELKAYGWQEGDVLDLSDVFRIPRDENLK